MRNTTMHSAQAGQTQNTYSRNTRNPYYNRHIIDSGPYKLINADSVRNQRYTQNETHYGTHIVGFPVAAHQVLAKHIIQHKRVENRILTLTLLHQTSHTQ